MSSLRQKAITAVFVVIIILIYQVSFLDFLGPLKAIPAFILIGQFFLMSDKNPMIEMGLSKPDNWVITVLISIVLAITIFYFRSFVVEEWVHTLFPGPKNLEGVTPESGSPVTLAGWIIAMFFFAALPEELVWRGFLIPQLASVMGEKNWSWMVSILVISACFGFAHSYQGPAGIASTFSGGLLYGVIYYLDRRSIWKVILVHWLVNSLSLIGMYYKLPLF